MSKPRYIGLLDYWPICKWQPAPIDHPAKRTPYRFDDEHLVVDRCMDGNGELDIKVFRYLDHPNLEAMAEYYGADLPESVKYIYTAAFQRTFVTMTNFAMVDPNICRASNSLYEFYHQDRAPQPNNSAS
ncbi:MAG: hypothetical protein AAF542_17780 [Pseudomonadota bacterium]